MEAGKHSSPYREFFLSSSEGIVLFNLEKNWREPNPKACEIFGYDSGALSAAALSTLIDPSSYRNALRAILVLRKKRKASGTLQLRRRNGRQFVAAFSASLIAGSRGAVIVRDITEEFRRRKELLETGEELTLCADAAPVPQAVFASRKLVRANAIFRSRFSWLEIGVGTLRDFFGRQNADLVRELSSGERSPAAGVLRREVELNAAEGPRREYAVVATPVTWHGRQAWFIVLDDITERKEALRSLRNSEETYRELFERQAGPVSLVQDGALTLVNRAYAAFFGFASPEELTGKDATLTVMPRDRKTFQEHLLSPVPGKTPPVTFEYGGRRSDGTQRTLEARCEAIFFVGRPAMLCHHTDITERRKHEEEIRRQAREQAIVEQLSHQLHLSLVPLEVMSAGLRSAMKWLGFESGGVYTLGEDGATLTLALDESLPERISSTLATQHSHEGVTGLVFKTAESLLLNIRDYPPYLPYKSLFESEGLRTILYLPLISGEAVNGVLLLCSSGEASGAASDRVLHASIARHAGDALANALRFEQTGNAELKYRTALESVSDVVYECTPAGAFLLVSPRVEQLLGYRPDEFMRNADLWRTILHPDDRPEYSRRISSPQDCEIEYRILPKGKAAYRWVREAVRYRRDSDGNVVAIHGIVSDITQKVEISTKAAAGEGFRADVLESVQDGVLVYDKDLHYREWNRAMELITGFDRDQVIGRMAFEGGPQFQLPEFPDLLHRALAGAPVSSEDVRFVRPGSGESSVLWCRFSPLRVSTGAIEGVVGTVTDVTHRKSLERELRESEETLRNVIDTMGDALMICDLQGRVWEVNREFSSVTGYARSEVIGLSFPYPWLVEEEMSRFVVWLAALREKKFLRDFDMTWKRHNGKEVAISLNTTLLRNAMGEPVAMLNLARDISERRRLAIELAAKNRQIEMLNRIISQANSTMDFARIFDVIAQEVRALVAYDHMNVSLLSDDGRRLLIHAAVGSDDRLPQAGSFVPLDGGVSNLAVTERHAVVIDSINAHPGIAADTLSVQAGMRSEISIPITLNEQILGTFNLCSAQESAFVGNELSYLQPIADQIGALIDRTQLFRRVSEDSAYIHNLLNSIDSVVYTVDQNSVVREVNKAWREFAMLQGTPELREETGVIGRRLEDIVAVPSLRVELPAVTQGLIDGSLNEYLREFELGKGAQARVFQLAVTPMAVRGRVTGLVFTYTDITESKRTEAEIKRRNEELLALNAVASSINRSLDLDDVLAVAAQQVRTLVQADIVLCYLQTDASDGLLLAAHVGIPDSHAESVRWLPVHGSAAGKVILERAPLHIRKNLAEDPRLSEAGRSIFRDLGAQSLLGIPLESKDRVLGVLLVAFMGEHLFIDQEERFLMLVGNQLGSALENVQLYSEVQAQVRRITLLYEIGRGLTGALDTRTILTVVYDGLKKSLPFESFIYFGTSGKSAGLQAQFERYRTGNGDNRLPAEDPGIAVAVAGTPFVGERGGGGSLLAVPVRSKGKLIGVLALTSGARDAYQEVHLRLLESIANLTEIAVDRAILYEDTVAKSEEIEQRNKELDDFTYVVSHDLKEPLITIEGYSKIVLEDYRDRVDEEGKGYLTTVVQSSQRMKGLIDDLLTLSRLGRVTETQETIPLADVIADVIRDFEFTLHESHASVTVAPGLPSVRYNRTQLGMVFRNLIANAIKFNKNPAPRVDIDVTRIENEFTIAVRDNGIGIEKQHYERIFVIFQRLHRAEDFRGTGAGLTIVKKIVENHHGKIWVDSVVGEGSTFYFTIPG